MKLRNIIIGLFGVKVVIIGITLFFFMLMAPLLLIIGDTAQEQYSYSNTFNGQLRLSDIPDVVPEELRYEEVDKESIIDWLDKKGSYLASDYHVQAIIAAGKRYNVHPLLLVAITGQEQSFVPMLMSI